MISKTNEKVGNIYYKFYELGEKVLNYDCNTLFELNEDYLNSKIEYYVIKFKETLANVENNVNEFNKFTKEIKDKITMTLLVVIVLMLIIWYNIKENIVVNITESISIGIYYCRYRHK